MKSPQAIVQRILVAVPRDPSLTYHEAKDAFFTGSQPSTWTPVASPSADTARHFRHSRDEQVRVLFPFPPDFIPAGQDGVYLRTVSPGSSFEVSGVALSADAELTPVIRAHASVHVIDLYNRNPTFSPGTSSGSWRRPRPSAGPSTKGSTAST